MKIRKITTDLRFEVWCKLNTLFIVFMLAMLVIYMSKMQGFFYICDACFRFEMKRRMNDWFTVMAFLNIFIFIPVALWMKRRSMGQGS